MDFKEKFPGAQPGKAFCTDGRELWVYQTKRPCWNCGRPTRFFDLDFAAFFCSEECLGRKNREFEEALRRGSRR